MKKGFLYFLFIVCITSISAEDLDQFRLTHNVEPQYQFIHLNIAPNEIEYSGYTNIDLEIKETLSSIRLHGKSFEIEKIELIHDDNSLPINYSFEEHGLLLINSKQELKHGKYDLNISFKGQFSIKGEGIARFEKDSLSYIFTQMGTIYARQFFPCFDEPNFKFPYQIEIVSPKDNFIASNTSVEKETTLGNNKTVLFKTTKPIPSYLLAFTVGPYETVTIPNISVPGRIILPKGYVEKSWYIKNNIAKILNALENYFGIPYPFEKLDFVCVSNFTFGGMENPGLVVIGDNFLIDAENLSEDAKYWRANITAHELAHMWFGNLVTMKWWDDTWLNEGFASWLALEMLIQEYPELNPLEKIAKTISQPLNVDIKSTAKPVQLKIAGSDNPLSAFNSLSYDKTQIVLRMVENWMGRDLFRNGMKKYFKKYKWGNTSSEDLFNMLQEVSGVEIKKVMNDFILEAGIPVISLKILNNNQIELTQQRYKSVENENNYETIWHIPIACKIFDGTNIYEKKIYLEQESQIFEFNDILNIEWINLRSNSHGYFIQVLPSSMLNKIINSNQLSSYEKNDILLGLDFSHKAGNISPTEIMELANSFKGTRDDTMIEAMAKRITNIKNTYFINQKNSLFDSYCLEIFQPLLDYIGVDYINDGLTNSKKYRLYLFYILKDNPKIVERISKVGKKYLFEETPLDWEKFIYALYHIKSEGDLDLYNYSLKRFEQTKDPTERKVFFQLLGSFNDSLLIEKNKSYVLNGDLSTKERIQLINYIQTTYNWDSMNKSILPWVAENYDFIKQTISSYMLDYFLPRLIGDFNDLKLFNQLFPKEKRSKELENEIEEKVQSLRRNEKLSALFSEDLKVYLENFKNSN